jgi:hypothetical protein
MHNITSNNLNYNINLNDQLNIDDLNLKSYMNIFINYKKEKK